MASFNLNTHLREFCNGFALMLYFAFCILHFA